MDHTNNQNQQKTLGKKRDSFDSLESLGNHVRRSLFGNPLEQRADGQPFIDPVTGIEIEMMPTDPSTNPNDVLNNSAFARGVSVQRGDMRNSTVNLPQDVIIEEEEDEDDDSHFTTPFSIPPGSLLVGNFTPDPQNRRKTGRGQQILNRHEAVLKELRDLKQRVRHQDALLENKQQLLENNDIRIATTEQERDQLKKELTEAWVNINQLNQNNPIVELETRRTNQLGQMDLKGALQLVKTFNGDSHEKLTAFLTSCQTAKKLVSPLLHKILLDTIIGSKLDGKALLQFQHKTIESFEEFTTELEAMFGKKKSLLGLHVEFNKFQQRPDEDVSRFGKRVETTTLELLDALQNLLHSELNEEQKIGARKALMVLAKANFEQGLRGQLQILVRAQNYRTLHEAVIGAIDLEKTMPGNINTKAHSENFSKSGHRQSLGRHSMGINACFNCGKPGHNAKDCKTIPQQRKSTLPVASDRRSVNTYGLVCKHCNGKNHEMKQCRKLKKELGLSKDTEIIFAEKNNSNTGTK